MPYRRRRLERSQRRCASILSAAFKRSDARKPSLSFFNTAASTEPWSVSAIFGSTIARTSPASFSQPEMRLAGASHDSGLNVVIEVELVRVGAQRDRIHLFFPLVTDPSFDHILGEDVALDQKCMIGLQRVECLLQRARRRSYASGFLERKVVKVFIDGLPWIDTVLDPIEAGHQHRRECQVTVAGGVGRTELDTFCAWVGRIHRNPTAGGTVALRIDQIDRRFVAGHQSTV